MNENTSGLLGVATLPAMLGCASKVHSHNRPAVHLLQPKQKPGRARNKTLFFLETDND
jgi:hypothetical protein